MLKGIQKYRGYRIRVIYPGGYAIERPDGTHWLTVEDYVNAVHRIDAALFVAATLSRNDQWKAYEHSRNRGAL